MNDDVLIIIIGVLLFVVIVLLLILHRNTFDKSYNKCLGYYVMAKYDNKQEAAKILHTLNIFGIKLIDEMHKKYNNNVDAMKIINRLINNYDPDKLQENDPIYTFGHKAYTLNFRKIAICLRKTDGKFYDLDVLKFVFLHELSHIGSIEKEHNIQFWTIFKYVLTCATSLVEYKQTNYSQYPMNYCGIQVSHNPYFEEYDISNLLTSFIPNSSGKNGYNRTNNYNHNKY